MMGSPPGISPSIDLDRFIYHCQQLLYPPITVKKRLEDQGISIVPANFYSSIPLLSDLDTTFEGPETDRQPVFCKIFNRSRIIECIQTMETYAHEFDPPSAGDENTCLEYFWNNSQFSYTDAMAYYCLIRHLRPRRIVEIGSGFSTLVADAAIRMNGVGEIICIEPHPRPFLSRIASLLEIIKKPIQVVAPDVFDKLIEPADILFIDSTHSVKIGSDCLYIYLVLMPLITKSLTVHSHDIFLPFGMPLRWARDLQIHWTEQYLLYAYLVDRPAHEVIFGSNYASHFLQDEVASLMGGKSTPGGGSLWYKLNSFC